MLLGIISLIHSIRIISLTLIKSNRVSAPQFLHLWRHCLRTVHLDRPDRVENRFSLTPAEKLAARAAGAVLQLQSYFEECHMPPDIFCIATNEINGEIK